MINLYCVQGKERGGRYPIKKDQEVIIGRDPGNDGLQFLDIMASRQHLKVALKNETLTITDLNSANGTRVNGQEIEDSIEAFPGDVLTMGNTSFVIEDPLHSTSGGDEVTRMSKQHRTSQRLKSHHPTQELNITDIDNADANLGLLTQLLATIPLATIIFDADNRILVANNAMKVMCNVELSVGQSVQRFFEQLQSLLDEPSELQSLLLSSQEQGLLLQTKTQGKLYAWSNVNDHIKSVYFLSESSLGKT